MLYQHTLNLKGPYCDIPEKYPVSRGRAAQVRADLSRRAGRLHHAPEGLGDHRRGVHRAVLAVPGLGVHHPGLKKKERRYTLTFVALSTILFAAGMALAYVVLSKGLRILVEQAGYGTQAQLTINDYISFVTLMLVVFGAAFELPLLVVMANLVGVLPARLLKKSQRVAIFLIFVFAAVATPSTDPFTMCAMAIPMVLLFEAAVVFAVFHDRRKAKRKAAATAAATAAAPRGRSWPRRSRPSPAPPRIRRLVVGHDMIRR